MISSFLMRLRFKIDAFNFLGLNALGTYQKINNKNNVM